MRQYFPIGNQTAISVSVKKLSDVKINKKIQKRMLVAGDLEHPKWVYFDPFEYGAKQFVKKIGDMGTVAFFESLRRESLKWLKESDKSCGTSYAKEAILKEYKEFKKGTK